MVFLLVVPIRFSAYYPSEIGKNASSWEEKRVNAEGTLQVCAIYGHH
jgi:hypothetical protein